MKLKSTFRMLTILPLLTLFMAGPPAARAANQMQYFFPIDHDEFNTLDDQIVVKSIFWSEQSQPVQWVLMSTLGGRVILPESNPLEVTDDDVEFAIERALKEWNNNPLSSFKYEDDVFKSNSGLVDIPKPQDIKLDGHNVMSFISSAATVESGAFFAVSFWFMEKDLNVQQDIPPLTDGIEIVGNNILIDVDLDNFVDFAIPARDYKQAEIIEADIAFNQALQFVSWPENYDDVPDNLKPMVPNSADVQAIATIALGFAQGLAPSLIAEATLNNSPISDTSSFRINPFDVRSLKYDDELASALLYPKSGLDSLGEIRGSIIDGQFIDALESATPPPVNALTLNDQFVVMAPVYLAVPAPLGTTPDLAIGSDSEGFAINLKLIASVFSGQTLIYPAALPRGASELEPAEEADPNIDFNDTGEWLFDAELNLYLPGFDTNNNGIVDFPAIDIDGTYRFIGVPPGDDYAIYIDADRYGNTSEGFTLLGFPSFAGVTAAQTFLSGLESFPAEFYGGAPAGSESRDTENDPREVIEFVSVVAGEVTDNIDIITNTSDPTDDTTVGTDPSNGGATGALLFAEDPEAISPTDYVASGGDMGDLNGDGYLDFVVSTFSGGSDAAAGRINRVFINEARSDGGRFFRDVSFGYDEVPGTSDDVMPALREVSRDAKLGDFDGDGRLDIFVSNAVVSSIPGSGPNRVFLNKQVGDNPWGLRFVDVSSQVLTGVLGHDWRDYPDDSSNVAVGDIDNDGDLDVIVSLLTPLTDAGFVFFNGQRRLINPPTTAVIDADPTDIGGVESPGDHQYDPTKDPIVGGVAGNINLGVGSRVDAGPVFGFPLMFSERVLINEPNPTPGGPGFHFVDATLGADFRFGDSTTIDYTEPTPEPYLFSNITLSDYRVQYGFGFRKSNLDRMPPVFPTRFVWSKAENIYTSSSPEDSPMGYQATQPLLGPMFREGSLDLASMRIFNDTFAVDGGFHSAGAAFFQNVDVDEDGLADGYFHCLNYDSDCQWRAGSGLYPIRTDEFGTTARLEGLPLFIGIPDGATGDFVPKNGENEGDLKETNSEGAFTAVLGDFDYRGSPKPLILTDADYGAPLMYQATLGTDAGSLRGQGGVVVGRGIYFDTWFGLPYNTTEGGVLEYTVSSLPALLAAGGGEPHGSVAADFDHDGDFDLLVANNTQIGFTPNGGAIAGEPPVPNTFYANDGFGTFTNSSDAVFTDLSNRPAFSYVALSGDIDNDGDLDGVFINAFSSHEVLLNQIYTPSKSADTTSRVDSTLFYDATVEYLPPYTGVSLVPPFAGLGASAKTTSVATADLNSDGFPDLLAADGGRFSLENDFVEIYLNQGPPSALATNAFNPGAKRYMPYGAQNPAPRISYFGPDTPPGGLGDSPGAFFGISTGDFSGDGYPDVFLTRNGKGPLVYVNLDTDDTRFVSVPDADTIPDGWLANAAIIQEQFGLTLIAPLADPCPDPSGQTIRKNFNRRLAAADFDGNGALDVVIANGVANGGAPNVLLLNNHLTGGDVPLPQFTDATETNLPSEKLACSLPEGLYDDTWAIGAADFDHDGDVDLVFANQTNTTLNGDTFPGFRYLENDGKGVFTDTLFTKGNFPSEYLDSQPRDVVVADFDGVGEWTEDLNHNGVLDFGEDFNGNGLLDRSEDRNGNGVLDPGEDLPEDINGDDVLQSWEDRNHNGILDYTGDGVMTLIDLPNEESAGDINGDGIITKRTAGVWEPSFDLYVTFENREGVLLINDPTNNQPGIFSDETNLRVPETDLLTFINTRGARAGDIDNDGDLDLVIAKQTINAYMRPVRVLRNNGRGIFADISYEVPFPLSVKTNFDAPNVPSLVGNAQDLELVDVDNDGDLDIYVGMAGPDLSLVTVGGNNLVYVNRTVGGNWNEGNRRRTVREAAKSRGVVRPPVIFFASPPAAMPGASLTVQVFGANFTPDTKVDFGPGITVGTVNVLGTSLLSAAITIDAAAEVGPRSVGASSDGTGLSTKSEPGMFYVGLAPSNAADAVQWTEYQ